MQHGVGPFLQLKRKAGHDYQSTAQHHSNSTMYSLHGKTKPNPSTNTNSDGYTMDGETAKVRVNQLGAKILHPLVLETQDQV